MKSFAIIFVFSLYTGTLFSQGITTDDLRNARELNNLLYLLALNLSDYPEDPENDESGEDQTWDFSDLEEAGQIECSYQNAEGQNGSENFPVTAFCHVVSAGSFSQVNAFTEFTETECIYLGKWSNTTGTENVSLCSDQEVQYVFPIEYESSWEDSYSCEKQPPLVGFQEDVSGTAVTVCDGVGTLILPSGSYTDCYRLKRTDTGEITSFNDGSQLSTLNFTTTTYSWMKAGYGIPLCTHVTIEYDGGASFAEFNFLVSDPLSVSSVDRDLDAIQLYPNPISGSSLVQIKGLVLDEPAEYILQTLDGKRVREGQIRETQITIENLAPGVYIFDLLTSDAHVFRRLVVK